MSDQNIMRHEYKTLTADEIQQVNDIKSAGKAFWDLCDGHSASREMSIAKTKIEEAVMWAVKHLTR